MIPDALTFLERIGDFLDCDLDGIVELLTKYSEAPCYNLGEGL